METPEILQIAFDVVHGRRDLGALAEIGISLRVAGNNVEVDNPSGRVIPVSPRDVAEGFVRLSDDPELLKRWATVLLSGAGFLDLKLEDDRYGQVLLEGLWDASDDGRVRQGALWAAKELFTA